VSNGATVYFANPDVFKGTLTKTLAHAEPTIFFAVPSVWEKLEERISEKLFALSKPKATLFKWARNSSFAHLKAEINSVSKKKFEFKLADKLVLNKIKRVLGLHEARIICSGAAPLAQRTIDFFLTLGITISEGFGMSELTGGITTCLKDKYRMGSVGLVNEFNKIKIANPDEHGNGEICIYGRSVFMGYLNDESKTREVFDQDGYLHTGDIGRIDNDGFLFVTGRIEDQFKNHNYLKLKSISRKVCENLSGAIKMVNNTGDKTKSVTVLITLKVRSIVE
jgi:long-chain-fatty-acid--CoA ligase ACSBG